MISLVICSRTKSIPIALHNNIDNTIGIEYELLVIDNSDNEYSIFEAYNLGIERSSGKYICFLHDDIRIETNNWGSIINRIFEIDNKIGLIGVAGSKIKTKMPSAWWDCPAEDKCLNIIQKFSEIKKKHWRNGLEEKSFENVAVIDGVFMAARKIDGILFSKKLKGFHNYDLNISFEYLKNGNKVVVTKDILLEHFSIGILNKSWYESSLEIHRLYDYLLPVNFSQKSLKEQEFKNGSKFLLNLIEKNIKGSVQSIWVKLFWMKPLSRFHLFFLKQILK